MKSSESKQLAPMRKALPSHDLADTEALVADVAVLAAAVSVDEVRFFAQIRFQNI